MYTQTTHDCHGTIIKHESEEFPHITCSRDTVDHIHVQIPCNHIYVVHVRAVRLEGSGLGSILIDDEVDLTAAGPGRRPSIKLFFAFYSICRTDEEFAGSC